MVKLDGIGDFIVALPTLQQIANSSCAFVGTPETSMIAKHLDFFTESFSLDGIKMRTELGYQIRLMWMLSGLKSERLYHPTFSRMFSDSDLACFLLWADQKITAQDDNLNKTWLQSKISPFFYSKEIPIDLTKPETFRYHQFLSAVTELPQSRLRTQPRSIIDDHPLKQLIQNLETPKASKTAILFPGAGAAIRMWPIDRFLQLGQHLQDKKGYSLVWMGGQRERQLFKGRIPQTLGENRLGADDLVTGIQLMATASLVITNDTSAAHIAGALDVRALVLVGGGHFERFYSSLGPPAMSAQLQERVFFKMDCFNCDWHCIHPRQSDQPALCIENISIDQTLAAIEKLEARTYATTSSKLH